MLFVSNAKPKRIKFLTWGIVTILLGSLASCGTPEITIEEIPQRESGRMVYLTGKVTQSAPFIDGAAYQLEDKTGKIWVVSDKKLPQLNRDLAIKGEIQYQSLPIAQQEFGDFYVIELERLETAKPNK